MDRRQIFLGDEEESENQLPILTEVKEKALKNEDGKPTHILIDVFEHKPTLRNSKNAFKP